MNRSIRTSNRSLASSVWKDASTVQRKKTSATPNVSIKFCYAAQPSLQKIQYVPADTLTEVSART